jgi:hypothetical protein
MLNSENGWSCSVDTTTVFATDIANTFMCYYVLRPEQLAVSDTPVA